MRPISLRALPLLALLLVIGPVRADVVRRTLAPGIEYMQETIAPPDGPLVYNVVTVNLKAPGVRVKTELGRDKVLLEDSTRGREAVGSLASRHGAIVGINADFFPFTGDPLGLAVRDGELISESMPHRVALALTGSGQVLCDTLLTVGLLRGSDGTITALDGINRLPAKDEIVLLTPAFGRVSQVRPPAILVPLTGIDQPIRIGQEVSAKVAPPESLAEEGYVLAASGKGAEWLRARAAVDSSLLFKFDFVTNPLPPRPRSVEFASRAGSLRGKAVKSVWTDVNQAVGGGPWLVRDGKVYVDGEAEGWSDASFTLARHPRTAAGVNDRGELLLVTVDGRQGFSRGVTLPELAQYLLKLGAVQAINLDGGGSTAMAVGGLYVNGPSDGLPRPVADALMVYSDQGAADRSEMVMDAVTIRAGEKVSLTPPENASPETAVWGTLEGRGFVTQGGLFTSTKAGTSTISLLRGGQRLVFPVRVEAGSPAKLRAALAAAPNNPPDRNMLTVVVTDAYGNPIAGQEVRFGITGGQAERPVAVTDAGGRVTVEVVWDVEKGRKATVTSGSLGPVTAK